MACRTIFTTRHPRKKGLELLSLYLLLVQLSPPPSLCQSTVYVWEGVAGGRWVQLETILCRTLALCIWPDSEPIKLLDHPKQKPRRAGGLRQINTCRKVPLQVNFFRWRQWLWCVHIKFISQCILIYIQEGCVKMEKFALDQLSFALHKTSSHALLAGKTVK